MNNEIDFPALYRAADTHSLEQQRQFFLLLGFQLTVLALTSLVVLLDTFQPLAHILRAILFFGVIALAIRLYSTKPDRRWYAARALAESVKTISWRYATRAEPFDSDHKSARTHFLHSLKEIVEQNKEVAGRFTTDLDGVQITQTMDSLRLSALDKRLSAYIDYRVIDQQNWYSRKSRFNADWAGRLFAALVSLLAIGGLLSLVQIAYRQASIWPTDFVIAVAASLLAWIQAKRFSELSAAYTLAAVEISRIRAQGAEIDDEVSFSHFVGDAENAFSREHTQWAARRDT